MLVLANEMLDSPPVFAWVLPVFVRLQPGKEETFSPRHGHVFFVFSTWSTSKRRQTMRGPGGKGQGKPGRGKGMGKGKGTSTYHIPGPGRYLVSVKWSIIN
jgi:hypothetical protein